MQPRAVQTLQSSPALKGPAFASVAPANFLNSLLNTSIPSAQPNALSYQLANGQPVKSGQALCSQPVIGSMTANSVNWMPNATQSSGLEERPRYGCTDSRAYNYDVRASVSVPGLCSYVQKAEGCTDPNALNYSPSAQVDNNTCVKKVVGCTNVYAANYDPQANVDSGCIPYLPGCTDPMAKNFDPQSTLSDNGSCWYPKAGCLDRSSPSYNWMAIQSSPNNCCAPKPIQYAKQDRQLAPGLPIPCDSCCK